MRVPGQNHFCPYSPPVKNPQNPYFFLLKTNATPNFYKTAAAEPLTGAFPFITFPTPLP